jgi:phosphomevalonate kinase
MVKQVLAWRAAQPDAAEALWGNLHKANQDLAAQLTALAEKQTSSSSSSSHDAATLLPLREAFTRIRTLLREMSSATGVPIEPAAQTRLLDASEAIPGVVGGVVPGAGGYDAIALLIEDREEVIDKIRALVAGWEFGDDEGGGKVSMLGVREEMEGVMVENVEDYSAR